jgi:hypothetical protein
MTDKWANRTVVAFLEGPNAIRTDTLAAAWLCPNFGRTERLVHGHVVQSSRVGLLADTCPSGRLSRSFRHVEVVVDEEEVVRDWSVTRPDRLISGRKIHVNNK